MGERSSGFHVLLRWLRRIGVALIALLVLLVFGVAPYFLVSNATLKRHASNADDGNKGLTPASFQLAFDEVEFKAVDGVTLRGWWVPAAGTPRGSVVLVHGFFRSRLEMVRKLPFLHEQGFSALLYDARHHGQSEGDRSSFGWFERLDVEAAVAEARRRTPGPAVVWGISMGAASTMLAAAETPDVDGVVCDSVYRSLDDTLHHHLQLLRGARWWLWPLPTGLLSREVLFWVRRLDGIDPEQVDIVRAAARLRSRPVLFVSNSGDRRMPTEIAFELKEIIGESARVLVVPGHTHGGAYREGQPAYENAVTELLDEVGSRYHRPSKS
jgi:pimeloyl-ACP methyl ester carboxylesterase